MLSNVKTYSVLHSVDNLSDHSPIQVVLNNMNIPYEKFYSGNAGERLNWHNAPEVNFQHYVCKMDDMLLNLSIPWKELKCQHSNCSKC